MALATLRDLMIDELRDLYSAEHQLVKLVPQARDVLEQEPAGGVMECGLRRALVLGQPDVADFLQQSL
jgi:hypothetical protein